jgi:catechol 2,3-dioxygenase-like lactoylglutathione lyase family enzyme
MVAVRSFREFVLNVADCAIARGFVDAFGFEISESGSSLTLRCPGREQQQVVIREAGGPLLERVVFGVDSGELGAMQARIEEHGAVLIDGDGPGLFVRDPHGNLVQIVEAEPAEPRPLDPWAANIAGRYERFDVARWKTIGGRTTPRRLGHALIFTPDQAATEAFYMGVLGLRLSDRITGKVTFMNTGAGDHHVFGCIQSTHPGFHHASFEVDDLDALGSGIDQLHQAGYRDGWGLGRHTLGSNFFHYARTPFGPMFEYFSDIDQITDAWVGSNHDVKPWAWGSPPPEDFLVNSSPM